MSDVILFHEFISVVYERRRSRIERRRYACLQSAAIGNYNTLKCINPKRSKCRWHASNFSLFLNYNFLNGRLTTASFLKDPVYVLTNVDP